MEEFNATEEMKLKNIFCIFLYEVALLIFVIKNGYNGSISGFLLGPSPGHPLALFQALVGFFFARP